MTEQNIRYQQTWHNPPTRQQRKEAYEAAPTICVLGYEGTVSTMYHLLKSYRECSGAIYRGISFINNLCFIAKKNAVVIIPEDGVWKRTINKSWYE